MLTFTCKDCGESGPRTSKQSHERLFCVARAAKEAERQKCANPSRDCTRTFPPAIHGKPRDYCSPKCRREAQNHRQKEARRAAVVSRKCANPTRDCPVVMRVSADNEHTLYCSGRCQKQAAKHFASLPASVHLSAAEAKEEEYMAPFHERQAWAAAEVARTDAEILKANATRHERWFALLEVRT